MKRIVRTDPVKLTTNSHTTSTTNSKTTNKPPLHQHTQNQQQQRAKSSEPIVFYAGKQNSASKLSSDKNSVCHPAAVKIDKTSNFFGPKLQTVNTNEQQSQQPKDNIAHVKVVETQTYNYGVPVKNQQQQPQSGFIHKRHYSSTLHNKKTKSSAPNVNSDNKVTADIFVYARKRPILETETQFSDAITIEDPAVSRTPGDIETNQTWVIPRI